MQIARRQIERRFDRVDAADQIVVLRGCGERADVLAADGEKHPARRVAQRCNGAGGVRDLGPAVAGDRRPCRPAQRQQSNSRTRCGGGGIGRDRRGIGMGGVDQRVDPFSAQIIAETCNAAEAAEPHRNGLRRRRRGAAGERQRHRKIGAAGQPPGQLPRLDRAAENENPSHAAR